jgi:hypothetical protein
MIVLLALVLAGAQAATAQPGVVAQAAAAAQAAAGRFGSYAVQVADPHVAVVGTMAGQLAAAARRQQASEVGTLLAGLRARGLAGAFTFDEAAGLYRAELSDAALAELRRDPRVASVVSEARGLASAAPRQVQGTQSPISSVIFAQVNSPFLWGNTNIGGLAVQLTLEDGQGNVIGVPDTPADGAGDACTALPDCVNVNQDPDNYPLYFETVFVNPNKTNQWALIQPGDYVSVTTTGENPAIPPPWLPQNKRVPVVDIQAGASVMQGTVSGTTMANATVIATLGTSLHVPDNYLTPGAGMTYAQVTSDSSGNFSASCFRTSVTPTCGPVTIPRGVEGFARVQVPNDQGQFAGDEVYTFLGQNFDVLENSAWVTYYAFPIAGAPGGLDKGVAAPRPGTDVTIGIENGQGGLSGEVSDQVGVNGPVYVKLGQTILGGNTVEATISYDTATSQVVDIATAPITPTVDLAGQQVAGTAPAGTLLLIAAGQVQGYVTEEFTYNDWMAQVTSTGSGSFASGPVLCGSSNHVSFQPGTFGYVGYETAGANFVYAAYAAPVNYVMSDFPFVDGWIASGVFTPTIAVAAANGSILQAPAPVPPMPVLLVNDKLPINTYYNTSATPKASSVYMEPGDVVTIVSGGRTSTIPVDQLTARLYAGQSIVAGDAPAGATLRVVPEKDRASSTQLTSLAGGGYAATNPYTSIDSQCDQSSTTETLNFGDNGRVFLLHPDGNEVFTTFYTRALHVLENSNIVWLTGWVTRGIDWLLPGSGPVTVTYTSPPGYTPPAGQTGTGTGYCQLQNNLASQTVQNVPIYQFNVPTNDCTQNNQLKKLASLIRPGGTVTATFDEGPVWLPRPVTLTMASLALETGIPDVDADTLAGVGPFGWKGPDTRVLAGYGVIDWAGTAGIQTPLGASVSIPHGSTTAWGPVRFMSGSSVLPLSSGYAGKVSFLDPIGNELYMSWAVTELAYQVKLTPPPVQSDSQVCGTVKAPAGLSLPVDVEIHDLTNNPTDVIIGSGSTNSGGLFCVQVSPQLYMGQVVMALVPATGSWSQPAVVGLAPSYTNWQNVPASHSIYGQPLSFAVTVTSTWGAPSMIPTGVVSFTVDNVAQPAQAVSGGQTTLTLVGANALPAGSHKIVANYMGDANFAQSASTQLTQVVSQASTAVTVTSSANPSAYGAGVTVAAQVTPAGGTPAGVTPTGQVVINVDGPPKPALTLSGGQVTMTLTGLGVGNHRITAGYNGDSNFLASSSALFTQVVSPASTEVILSPSANPSTYGAAVNVTAMVTSAGGTPQGQVIFQVDGGSPSSPWLGGGRLTYGLPALPVGAHQILATYNGNGIFAPSTAYYSQVVNPVPGKLYVYMPMLKH